MLRRGEGGVTGVVDHGETAARITLRQARGSRAEEHGDAAARNIEEAARRLASQFSSALMMPQRGQGKAGGVRTILLTFSEGDTALLSIAGARSLHMQLDRLLAVHDGKVPGGSVPIDPKTHGD